MARPKNNVKTMSTNIHLPVAEHAKLAAAAKREDRTMKSLCRRIINEWLAANGGAK